MALLLRKLFGIQYTSTIGPQLSAMLTIQNYKHNSTSSSTNTDDPDAPSFDMPNPFTKHTEKCILCEHGIEVNYKNVKLLSQFQSTYTGRVYGRHITGLCKSQQERVEKEIVKAQSAGLMGYYNKDPHFLRDPELFDPERPIRPHRF